MKCPKCDQDFYDAPALSREDNATKICSECAMKEAIEDFEKFLEQKSTSEKVN